MLPVVFFPVVGGLFSTSMEHGEDTKGKGIARTVEMENLSLDISSNRFSRDLLQRFRGSSMDSEAGKGEATDEDVELNLGLSLGGTFGVDSTSKPLVRSSSIASFLPVTRDDSDAAATAMPAAPAALARTASMPVETEEAWRKRKEVQSLRRMEAKRRRSEKLRNLRIDKEGTGSGGLTMKDRKEIESNLPGRLDKEKSLSAPRRSNSSARSLFRLSDLTGVGSGPVGKESHFVTGGGSSQGSVESKAGSSSSLSDFDSMPMAGSSGEVSPGSIQSMQESGSQEGSSSSTKAKDDTGKSAGSELESPSKSSNVSRVRGSEMQANSLEDMPCVFTKGDGPNGRRVDGILYKYGKGNQVRIMCVCHGTFHSPADFIRHAGGTDVDNPLKHIVVNPNSSSLL